ncbi:5-oxoprolinase/urea amidolyase family protein [Thioclava sp. GXIMD2076]|uniref:5-oxoprolinase/urea amidolyase family protein n=1 Tax=Thioclava kandeliae TaxID=3070818 RepID=A0ABV1SL67_9RHOB
MRVLPVALEAVLVELDSLEEVLALHESLREAPLAGVTEMVPAARTLFIGFDPLVQGGDRIAAEVARRDLTPRAQGPARLRELPTRYEGEDLAEVAALTGLSVAEVIARHQSQPWTVAFCGFAPGFGYMTGGDPALDVPRRQSPRTRIPAGAVALAGKFSGVYPKASPGGWQIIGTTDVPMWDLSRDPPAFLQPGDHVQFTQARGKSHPVVLPMPETRPAPAQGTGFRVTASPFPALFQDLGRLGQAGQGVSASGVLDRHAFRALNRMLGNAPGTPAIELTGGGFAFRAEETAVIAVTGAPCAVKVNGWNLGSHAPLALDAGDHVEIGAPLSGLRSLLGVRGGFDVERIMGSATRDTLAEVGPEPLGAGAVLELAHARAGAVEPALSPPELPRPGETVVLDVVMGPRTDWFSPETVAALSGQLWEVTPQSSRVGIRLSGEALTREDARELPSEGTATGALQVPHSGQPVLFLADHPLTGGYPVIGSVASYHLDLAGQIPPGAKIRFNPLAPFAEILSRGSK